MTVRLPTVDVVKKPVSKPIDQTSDVMPLRVLIADDEAMVRRSLRRMLELNRTQVVEVGDGAAALEMLAAAGPPFDIALLDMVMPRMTGHDVLVEIRNRKLSTKVVLMSGYNDLNPHGDDAQQTHDADARLQKPFAWDELKRVLNNLVHGDGPSFGDH
jgi:CheY-like chemotaxis protein